MCAVFDIIRFSIETVLCMDVTTSEKIKYTEYSINFLFLNAFNTF